MSKDESDSLADAIRDRGRQAKTAAVAAMISLAQIADQLDMHETATRLKTTESQLRSDTFNLIVMGRFKNGKSTLLNALMGGTTRNVELDGHKGPMVVDDLPATATLTAVRYADEPYVTAWSFDGKSEKWSMRRYLQESTLDIDDEANQKRFGQIREFEMGFPAKLCQAGVTVFDSPGLDEHETRTLVIRDATKRCDAAIAVYRSDVLMGQGELMDAARLVADGTRIFTVVNLFQDRAADDRLREFVWNKYVHDHLGGPTRARGDPAEQRAHRLTATLLHHITGNTRELTKTLITLANELRSDTSDPDAPTLPTTLPDIIRLIDADNTVHLGDLVAALYPDPTTAERALINLVTTATNSTNQTH